MVFFLVVFCHNFGEIGHGAGLHSVLDVLQRWTRFDVKPVDADKHHRGHKICRQMSVTQFK